MRRWRHELVRYSMLNDCRRPVTTPDDYQMVVKMVVKLWRCQPQNPLTLADVLGSQRAEKRRKLLVRGNC
jgi:hypothetical protein